MPRKEAIRVVEVLKVCRKAVVLGTRVRWFG